MLRSDIWVWVGAMGLVSGLVVPELSAQNVDEITVTPTSVAITIGERKPVVATAYGANGGVLSTARIVWTSTNLGLVRVEFNQNASTVATLIGVSPGVATVEARVGRRVGTIAVQVTGGGGVVPITGGGNVPAVQGEFGSGIAVVLQVNPTQLFMLQGEGANLVARFLRADGNLASAQRLTWSSLQPSIASVTERGQVVAINPGGGMIQVTTASGLSARVPVQVDQTAFAFPVPAISMSPGTQDTARVVVPLQGNRRLAATSVQWQSTNQAVVTVSPLGVLTARTPGTAQIVATGFLQQQRLNVTVHRQVEDLIVSPRMSQTVYVPLGGFREFTVEALAADDTPVPEAVLIWSQRDTSVIRFDVSTGLATGLALGSDTISVRAPGPGRLQADWNVEVIAGGLLLSSHRAGFGIGDQLSLNAQFTDSDGTPISPATGIAWSSSDESVVEVDEQGTVTANGFGVADVVVGTPWGAADTLRAFVQGEILVSSNRGADNLDIFSFERNNTSIFNRVTNDPEHDLSAEYSPDGTMIAFVSFVGNTRDIFVANADGSDRRNITQSPSNEDQPIWTRDGSRIIFESNESGSAQIWTMNLDGSDKVRLTQGPASNTQPAINAAGNMIAFSSTRDGNYEIYTMNLDGSDQRNVTGSQERESSPAWFPDESLSYIRANEIVKIESGARGILSTQGLAVTDFAISKNGDLLAMIVSALTATGQTSKLYLLPLGGAPAGPLEIRTPEPTERILSVSFRQ